MMNSMSVMVASIALTAVLAQSASPPSGIQRPTSVNVLAGYGRTWDDEGSIGTGGAIGGAVEYRFRPKLSVNGAIERLAHDRDTGFLHFSGRTVFATLGLTYHFAASGVSPYVGGGFGGAFYKGQLRDTLALPPPGIVSPRSSTSTLGYGSAGVDIPIGDRFVVSPDVRIALCQPQDDFAPWSTIRFGVKAAVRF
jgi:outer membrane protein W